MKTLLLLFGTAKFGKFLLSGGTMVLAVFAYALVYGWRYAAGFVGLIFVHELGHFVAARNRGLDVGLPTFIPFVGAWIDLKEQPLDAETEAYVGIAGPMLGTAGAFVLYLLAGAQGSGLLLALAYAGFMLNLFNLIPLHPLDGGRIVGVISPRIWFLGVPLLVGLFLWRPSPLLLLVALLAGPQLWRAFKTRGEPLPSYYDAHRSIRASYGFQYVFLVCALAILAFEVHSELERRGG